MPGAKKLSIIIISKNEEKNIGKLLASIKKQRFPVPYEVIVADNNSKDATVKIVKSYGLKVVKGGLPAAGRNAGARHATGDLLLFLDADTILPRGFIAKNLWEFTQRNLCTATVLTKVNTNRLVHRQTFQLWNLLVLSAAPFSPYAAGYCILCTAEIHRRIAGFNSKLVIGEDSDYVNRASKHGKFGVLLSVPIITSARRLEKEGVVKLCTKWIAYTALKAFVGEEKANIFEYDFDHSRTKKKARRLKLRLRPLLPRIRFR